MTRINSAIDVSRLTDEHLLAEHREIKRLPNVLCVNEAPNEFALGPGHVLFFIGKPGFTKTRYLQIHEECRLRGFSVQDYSSNWAECLEVDYEPTKFEYDCLIHRIIERLLSKTNWRYYGNKITNKEAISLLLYGHY
jgi:hypothetical protein